MAESQKRSITKWNCPCKCFPRDRAKLVDQLTQRRLTLFLNRGPVSAVHHAVSGFIQPFGGGRAIWTVHHHNQVLDSLLTHRNTCWLNTALSALQRSLTSWARDRHGL